MRERILMRKWIGIWFVIVLVSVVIGCSMVKGAVDNYAACKGDSECVAKMQRVHDVSAGVATSVVPVIPFSVPFSDRIIEGIAVLCATLGGIVYGRKVRKKKE